MSAANAGWTQMTPVTQAIDRGDQHLTQELTSTQGLPGPVISARAVWLAGLMLVVVTILTRGIWLGNPVADFDEQLYSFIGWRMTHGELPFVDWWDRKPFGLFAIFAFAHALMGPGPVAYQLLAAAFALGGAVLVLRLVQEMTDLFAGAIAGALYLLLIAAYASFSGQTEVFFLPLMLGMVWLLRDPAHPDFARRALWAMLLGGLALQIKYSVLPQCLFLGGWALWHHARAGKSLPQLAGIALSFAVMGLLPTMLVGLFYAAIGQWNAFVFANFLSFFDREAASQGRWAQSHWIGVAPIAILVIGGLYASMRMDPPKDRARYIFYVMWALASLATVLLPGTVYLYYYAALVPAAVLVATPLIGYRHIPALVLLGAAFYILQLPDRWAQSRADSAAATQLATAIAPHVGATDNCLFIFDGPTALYRMTGSCVPTRFAYPDHLNNALESNALGVGQDIEVARVLATVPGAIVTADRPMTHQNPVATGLVESALALGYREEATVTMHGRKLTAWVRRTDQP
ncbi:hypothetical protein GCM10009127_24170 [Alteraurantiacibacter aestuarii]|uniref:glycosyltransferase family 39 protein n=1 Tax=Alteraurantiacibacter aestuarii TaxID=650004 RepID=UPI0031D4EC6A